MICWFVAPLAGAWIETCLRLLPMRKYRPSRPSRARGLKRTGGGGILPRGGVAPLAGAWIETRSSVSAKSLRKSRPSRARGLKPPTVVKDPTRPKVAPLAGAWIETCGAIKDLAEGLRRAPRGRVD